MAVVVFATFLIWEAEESVAGTDSNEGQLAFIVGLVTIGLIQIGWRPAWIGAGFVSAVAGRQLLDTLGDDSAEPGVGLWIATVAALVAAVVLVVAMFSTINRNPPPSQR